MDRDKTILSRADPRPGSCIHSPRANVCKFRLGRRHDCLTRKCPYVVAIDLPFALQGRNGAVILPSDEGVTSASRGVRTRSTSGVPTPWDLFPAWRDRSGIRRRGQCGCLYYTMGPTVDDRNA